jgi:hypothetical protein
MIIRCAVAVEFDAFLRRERYERRADAQARRLAPVPTADGSSPPLTATRPSASSSWLRPARTLSRKPSRAVDLRSARSCLPSYLADQRSGPGAVEPSASAPSAACCEAVGLTVAGSRSYVVSEPVDVDVTCSTLSECGPGGGGRRRGRERSESPQPVSAPGEN